VKIARIGTVDRNEWDVSEVDTSDPIRLAHASRKLVCLPLRFRRKLVWHAELPNSDLHFHAGVVDFTQHFHDPPDRLGVPCWLSEDLNGHHLARLCPTSVIWSN